MSDRRGEGLTEEKLKKIAAGTTATGVLLILFLIVILIVQFVQIGIANKRNAEYDAAIEQYEELLKNGEVTLETLQAEETLRELAIQNGWTLPR